MPLPDDDLDLQGRVALVTGGSRGIGRAVVKCLARAGVQVAFSYLKDKEAAEESALEAEKFGVRALKVQADVSELKGAAALVEETLETFGRLDLLICNAGIWEGAPVDSLSEELWDQTLDVNLKGSWAVCRAAVPEMKRAGFGRIVLLSSTAGQRGEAFYSNYAASKGAQIAFMKSLAVELAPHGINVNAVAPGWVDTEMSARALSPVESREKILREIPLGRIATAEDIALPVLFLCSRWARHVNGEVLSVNGGSVL